MDSVDRLMNLNLDTRRLSHAYIISGGIADAFAMAAVCSGAGDKRPCMLCTNCSKASRRIHPDIIIVDKPSDKREIVVDQIRRLKKDVIIVPVESEKKVYIINNADLMNVSAQNAFLQILEEPPGYAVFILSTETPAALLPTVRSRCVELKVLSETEGIDSVAAEMADGLFSAAEQGNMQLVRFMFQLEKLDKESFRGFLTAARERAAGILSGSASAVSKTPRATVASIDRVLIKAAEMLDLNVSAGHLSGLICSALIK